MSSRVERRHAHPSRRASRVVAFDWVSACLAARRRVEEESFEIDGDTQGGNGGPKAGRLRKQSGGPPLFHGAGTTTARRKACLCVRNT